MNKVDIAVVVMFALSYVAGLFRGLTKEILGLLSWGGAAVGAYFGKPFVFGWIHTYITSKMLADIVSIFVVFIVFLIIFSLIGHMITRFVKDSPLGGIDRSLGGGFGLLRAGFIVVVAELVYSLFYPRSSYIDMVKESRFSTFAYQGSDYLVSILPKSAKDYLQSMKVKNYKGASKKIATPIDAQDKPDDVKDLAVLKPKEKILKKVFKDTGGEVDRLLGQLEDDDTPN